MNETTLRTLKEIWGFSSNLCKTWTWNVELHKRNTLRLLLLLRQSWCSAATSREQTRRLYGACLVPQSDCSEKTIGYAKCAAASCKFPTVRRHFYFFFLEFGCDGLIDDGRNTPLRPPTHPKSFSAFRTRRRRQQHRWWRWRRWPPLLFSHYQFKFHCRRRWKGKEVSFPPVGRLTMCAFVRSFVRSEEEVNSRRVVGLLEKFKERKRKVKGKGKGNKERGLALFKCNCWPSFCSTICLNLVDWISKNYSFPSPFHSVTHNYPRYRKQADVLYASHTNIHLNRRATTLESE